MENEDNKPTATAVVECREDKVLRTVYSASSVVLYRREEAAKRRRLLQLANDGATPARTGIFTRDSSLFRLPSFTFSGAGYLYHSLFPMRLHSPHRLPVERQSTPTIETCTMTTDSIKRSAGRQAQKTKEVLLSSDGDGLCILAKTTRGKSKLTTEEPRCKDTPVIRVLPNRVSQVEVNKAEGSIKVPRGPDVSNGSVLAMTVSTQTALRQSDGISILKLHGCDEFASSFSEESSCINTIDSIEEDENQETELTNQYFNKGDECSYNVEICKQDVFNQNKSFVQKSLKVEPTKHPIDKLFNNDSLEVNTSHTPEMSTLIESKKNNVKPVINVIQCTENNKVTVTKPNINISIDGKKEIYNVSISYADSKHDNVTINTIINKTNENKNVKTELYPEILPDNQENLTLENEVIESADHIDVQENGERLSPGQDLINEIETSQFFLNYSVTNNQTAAFFKNRATYNNRKPALHNNNETIFNTSKKRVLYNDNKCLARITSKNRPLYTNNLNPVLIENKNQSLYNSKKSLKLSSKKINVPRINTGTNPSIPDINTYYNKKIPEARHNHPVHYSDIKHSTPDNKNKCPALNNHNNAAVLKNKPFLAIKHDQRCIASKNTQNQLLTINKNDPDISPPKKICLQNDPGDYSVNRTDKVNHDDGAKNSIQRDPELLSLLSARRSKKGKTTWNKAKASGSKESCSCKRKDYLVPTRSKRKFSAGSTVSNQMSISSFEDYHVHTKTPLFSRVVNTRRKTRNKAHQTNILLDKSTQSKKNYSVLFAPTVTSKPDEMTDELIRISFVKSCSQCGKVVQLTSDEFKSLKKFVLHKTTLPNDYFTKGTSTTNTKYQSGEYSDICEGSPVSEFMKSYVKTSEAQTTDYNTDMSNRATTGSIKFIPQSELRSDYNPFPNITIPKNDNMPRPILKSDYTPVPKNYNTPIPNNMSIPRNENYSIPKSDIAKDVCERGRECERFCIQLGPDQIPQKGAGNPKLGVACGTKNLPTIPNDSDIFDKINSNRISDIDQKFYDNKKICDSIDASIISCRGNTYYDNKLTPVSKNDAGNSYNTNLPAPKMNPDCLKYYKNYKSSIPMKTDGTICNDNIIISKTQTDPKTGNMIFCDKNNMSIPKYNNDNLTSCDMRNLNVRKTNLDNMANIEFYNIPRYNANNMFSNNNNIPRYNANTTDSFDSNYNMQRCNSGNMISYDDCKMNAPMYNADNTTTGFDNKRNEPRYNPTTSYDRNKNNMQQCNSGPMVSYDDCQMNVPRRNADNMTSSDNINVNAPRYKTNTTNRFDNNTMNSPRYNANNMTSFDNNTNSPRCNANNMTSFDNNTNSPRCNTNNMTTFDNNTNSPRCNANNMTSRDNINVNVPRFQANNTNGSDNFILNLPRSNVGNPISLDNNINDPRCNVNMTTSDNPNVNFIRFQRENTNRCDNNVPRHNTNMTTFDNNINVSRGNANNMTSCDNNNLISPRVTIDNRNICDNNTNLPKCNADTATSFGNNNLKSPIYNSDNYSCSNNNNVNIPGYIANNTNSFDSKYNMQRCNAGKMIPFDYCKINESVYNADNVNSFDSINVPKWNNDKAGFEKNENAPRCNADNMTSFNNINVSGIKTDNKNNFDNNNTNMPRYKCDTSKCDNNENIPRYKTTLPMKSFDNINDTQTYNIDNTNYDNKVGLPRYNPNNTNFDNNTNLPKCNVGNMTSYDNRVNVPRFDADNMTSFDNNANLTNNNDVIEVNCDIERKVRCEYTIKQNSDNLPTRDTKNPQDELKNNIKNASIPNKSSSNRLCNANMNSQDPMINANNSSCDNKRLTDPQIAPVDKQLCCDTLTCSRRNKLSDQTAFANNLSSPKNLADDIIRNKHIAPPPIYTPNVQAIPDSRIVFAPVCNVDTSCYDNKKNSSRNKDGANPICCDVMFSGRQNFLDKNKPFENKLTVPKNLVDDLIRRDSVYNLGSQIDNRIIYDSNENDYYSNISPARKTVQDVNVGCDQYVKRKNDISVYTVKGCQKTFCGGPTDRAESQLGCQQRMQHPREVSTPEDDDEEDDSSTMNSECEVFKIRETSGTRCSPSMMTLFRIKSKHARCTPNLGTSIVSFGTEDGMQEHELEHKPVTQKSTFMMRLTKFLKKKKVKGINEVYTSSPRAATVWPLTSAKTSLNSYYINSSLAQPSMASSVYDTSVSHYSEHSVVDLPALKARRRSLVNKLKNCLK